MKYTIRVPLDQFAYLETEIEGTAEDALREYKHAKTQFLTNGEGLAGLSAKEVDGILDSWFKGTGVAPDLYSKCNPEQDKWFQAVKRSLKRIKSHATDDSEDSEIHHE